MRAFEAGAASSRIARGLSAALEEMREYMLALCSDAGELEEDLRRILCAGGKCLRPSLAWACFSLAGGDGEILPLMCMLELMHTASLIHDDFVDGALLRRGKKTISASSGGMAAVRAGDYLLSRAMTFLKVYRGSGINEALSEVSQEMCRGELEQRAGLFSVRWMTRETYFSRIRAKTALLMAESCRSGAVAGGAGEDTSRALWEYGLHVGLAFQIRDDLLDWLPDSGTGKAPMQDLRSGVITLPMLIAVKKRGGELSMLLEKREKTPEELCRASELVLAGDTLERTRAELCAEGEKALSALGRLPKSEEMLALRGLAETIMEVKGNGSITV